MGRFTKAVAASKRFCQKNRAGLLLAAGAQILIVRFYQGSHIGLLCLAAGVFSFMVVEDYVHQTVDLYLYGALLLFLLSFQSAAGFLSLEDAVNHWFQAVIFFFLPFYSSMRFIEPDSKPESETAQNPKPEPETAVETETEKRAETKEKIYHFGFLPSLAAAMLIYCYALNGGENPLTDCAKSLEIAWQDLKYLLLPAAVWRIASRKRREKRWKKQGGKILYGMGAGDVLVLAACAALFGMGGGLLLFSLALLIHLFYLSWQKHQKEAK